MGQMQTIGRHKTTVHTECGTTTVRYVDTDVVTFDAGLIMLQTGGYRTATTKARMNQTANQFGLGFTVYQRDFGWFVKTSAGTVPFEEDTLTLDRTRAATATLDRATMQRGQGKSCL